jgi:hypothetical protein
MSASVIVGVSLSKLELKGGAGDRDVLFTRQSLFRHTVALRSSVDKLPVRLEALFGIEVGTGT